jgi:hypothetical protein
MYAQAEVIFNFFFAHEQEKLCDLWREMSSEIKKRIAFSHSECSEIWSQFMSVASSQQKFLTHRSRTEKFLTSKILLKERNFQQIYIEWQWSIFFLCRTLFICLSFFPSPSLESSLNDTEMPFTLRDLVVMTDKKISNFRRWSHIH